MSICRSPTCVMVSPNCASTIFADLRVPMSFLVRSPKERGARALPYTVWCFGEERKREREEDESERDGELSTESRPHSSLTTGIVAGTSSWNVDSAPSNPPHDLSCFLASLIAARVAQCTDAARSSGGSPEAAPKRQT
ncbi:ABC-2 type transporter family protein [Striga asiatica]|uniref:ABC-2 type transporter family protein n=1 Tax=Striga asiatica TaxID=4170 RepID=A0A5A7Q6S5_STRAF|nr:ABC-2 type transporter family protein [Striga asiatica]